MFIQNFINNFIISCYVSRNKLIKQNLMFNPNIIEIIFKKNLSAIVESNGSKKV